MTKKNERLEPTDEWIKDHLRIVSHCECHRNKPVIDCVDINYICVTSLQKALKRIIEIDKEMSTPP